MREVLQTVGVPVTIMGPDACDGCPSSEEGLCADGIDNDEWLEMAASADCFDSDCRGDVACPAEMAPAASDGGLAIVAAAMLGLGLLTAGRRYSRGRSPH